MKSQRFIEQRPSPDRHTPADLDATDARLSNVQALLSALGTEPPAPLSIADTVAWPIENQLELVRRGVAGSLLTALRAKHAPTALHSVRVALQCSAWAVMLELSETERDELEVAALLHDVGKLFIPDVILQKPGRLTPEESGTIDRHRQTGPQMLETCSAPLGVLQIVKHLGSWFDGSRGGSDLQGELLPRGTRIVAIADAFDSMTCDQPYRRALSHERAVAELFDYAGTQFDPRLVEAFCEYLSANQARLHTALARTWLQDLERSAAQRRFLPDVGPESCPSGAFYRILLENMNDAVVLVDSSLKIMLWNQAAERLSGIASAGIEHQRWTPELLNLRDVGGQLIGDTACPVSAAVTTGIPLPRRRLSILGRGGDRIEVEAQLVPVTGKNGVTHGAALLMNDASTQVTLEEKVQSLHEKAARDPLTNVANRAEFDRLLSDYVMSHVERGLPCSLILCDVDHFKNVNDTFGHQAGDEALILFAKLLQRHCRSAGDLVARYGGEEFVLLCADCCAATAARRAEELRIELAGLPQTALLGKCITSSFGVTQVQSGDTPQTMLRRADRALYQAKANGRNTVVQLGSGLDPAVPPPALYSWLSWFWPRPGEKIIEQSLATSVPLNIVVEKVRGFVSDHSAQIESISEDHVVLRLIGESLLRRRSDGAIAYMVDLRFEESRLPSRRGDGKVVRTIVNVAIRPQRSRDRRRGDLNDQAQRLFASIKSYLMAWDSESTAAAATRMGR